MDEPRASDAAEPNGRNKGPFKHGTGHSPRGFPDAVSGQLPYRRQTANNCVFLEGVQS